MTIGIRYISYGDNSGYGLAALAYVRALHNLGVPVRWEPRLLGPQAAPWQPESGLAALPLAHAATRDNDSSDVPALIAATARPIDYDTIVVHMRPEHWSRVAEPGKRLVGYTTWESDALPQHWQELLAAADVILVPSTFNAALFASAGTRGASRRPRTQRPYAGARRFQTITSSSTAWVHGIHGGTWPG